MSSLHQLLLMRTTLNIDAGVFQAAKAKAGYEGITIGQALSELARKVLEPAPTVNRRKRRLPQFILPGNVFITGAAIRESQEEDDY